VEFDEPWAKEGAKPPEADEATAETPVPNATPLDSAVAAA